MRIGFYHKTRIASLLRWIEKKTMVTTRNTPKSKSGKFAASTRQTKTRKEQAKRGKRQTKTQKGTDENNDEVVDEYIVPDCGIIAPDDEDELVVFWKNFYEKLSRKRKYYFSGDRSSLKKRQSDQQYQSIDRRILRGCVAFVIIYR